jgi:hypothetical protein
MKDKDTRLMGKMWIHAQTAISVRWLLFASSGKICTTGKYLPIDGRHREILINLGGAKTIRLSIIEHVICSNVISIIRVARVKNPHFFTLLLRELFFAFIYVIY